MPAVRRKKVWRTRRKNPYIKARGLNKTVTKTIKKIVKQQTLKQCETKWVSQQYENQNCNHNSIRGVFDNLLSTSQGTTDNTRVGDEIYAKGVKLKFWVSNKADRPNVMYRFFVLSCASSSSVPSDLFYGISGNKIVDTINTDKYKVIATKQFHIGSDSTAVVNSVNALSVGNGGKEQSKAFSMWIPIKRKIKYESNGGTTPKYSNNLISVFVVAYDAYGTLTTDTIGSYACSSVLYFKDP